MTAEPAPADDRTVESVEMVTEPAAGDPADLTGSAAAATAGQMHDEVDEIAAAADPDAPGHGARPE